MVWASIYKGLAFYQTLLIKFISWFVSFKTFILITRDKLAKEIGKRIREIREKKGISLKQFETHENSIERGDLSEIENGHKLASVFTLYKIAQILGVKISDFIKE